MLTTEDVARIFGKSIQTIRFWLVYKHLGDYGKKLNRIWLFSLDELEQFMVDDAAHWMSKVEWDNCMDTLKREGGEQYTSTATR